MILLSGFIEKIKENMVIAKKKFENFELDQRNEFEEAIVIKRVPGIQKMNIKREENGEESEIKLHMDHNSDGDWTDNKPKTKQLGESIDKMLKTLDQILRIYQDNLKNTTSNEAKINRVLTKQEDQSVKVYLFRRLVRIYFGERFCLKDLIQKLMALIELLNFVKVEMNWIWKTFYENESIDKLISIETKQDIFSYLQECKLAEVSVKVFTMHCVSTHLFKQFEIVQILLKDTYPDFKTHASMDDLHSWQQTIRKGSKRIALDEDTAHIPKSPCRSPREVKNIEELNSTPRKQSDSKESPYGQSASPVRSSKK